MVFMSKKEFLKIFTYFVFVLLVAFSFYKIGYKNRGGKCDLLAKENYSYGYEDGKKKGKVTDMIEALNPEVRL